MKHLAITIFAIALFCIESKAQYNYYVSSPDPLSLSELKHGDQDDLTDDPVTTDQVVALDYYLAIIPGAVQIRKERYGYAAAFIGSTIAFTTLIVSQSARIRQARIDADAAPTHADFYDRRIHKAKQWQTIGWIGLGLTEVLNYAVALRLEDNSHWSYFGVSANPEGNIGITYALHF